MITKILKAGYALLLLQIAAKVIYEKNGFCVTDKESQLSFEALKNMVKEMNANLTLSGQPIETETRFIEGSLSYLRKATALMYIISDAGHGK